MSFTTFNDMLERMALRLPDKTFLYWSDKDRAISYAEGVELTGKVVLYPDQQAILEQLLAYCQAELGVNNSPALIEIISQMSMTSTGKIGRAQLQKREKGG